MKQTGSTAAVTVEQDEGPGHAGAFVVLPGSSRQGPEQT